MKPALAAVLLSLGLASSAFAEDLLRVYQDALTNDPQIREADATRQANREARPQALSALLPQADASADYSRVKSDETQLSAFDADPSPDAENLVLFTVPRAGTTKTLGYTLELRQNLFSWGNWMTLRRANKEVAQAEADYVVAQQDLVFRVARRYFDVLAAENLVQAQQAALAAIGRQFDQANKRFEVGLIAVTDVQEAKAARDSAAAALIAAKRQLATAQQVLREITNREYSTLSVPNETMPLQSPDPSDAERWVELSMNQNAALISSRLAADIARADVSIARGGHFPTLDAFGRRQKSSFDLNTTSPIAGSFEDLDGTTDTIGVQFNLPIFKGGFTTSQTRQSQFRWIAAKERLSRTSRETERLARDAYLGVISEISRVNALKQALESSQTALKATEAGYEVGTRTAVDVLASRQTLVGAQTDYARSRYDYILNIIQLRLAAGDLDEKTIAEINAWLTDTPPPPPTQPSATSESPTPPPAESK